MLRKTYFIADIHLEEDQASITQQFLSLLANLGTEIDALYILGDLFEAWIGDDDTTPFHLQVIAALKAVTTRGIPVYVMHGNRDFLLGPAFLAATGCQLLADETMITLYQQPVLLMHGDTLCTDDHAYLRLRRLTHQPYVQRLFMCIPRRFRKKIANALRAKSEDYKKHASVTIMDVNAQAVHDVMVKHAVNYLIHGHTHRPGEHELQIRNQVAKRIVLGAWHGHGSAFVWSSDGSQAVLTLPVVDS